LRAGSCGHVEPVTSPDLQALGDELVAIHRDGYGVTADAVRVHLLGDDVVVFLDGLELQRVEEFLLEQGRYDLVLNTRSGFQASISLTFSAAVERFTGRRVIAFSSVTHLDPHFAVEIFRLAP
jgi:uncharacterized protein YbcI